MPSFYYKTMDQAGKREEGFLDAPDRETAAASLRERQLFVLTLGQTQAKADGDSLLKTLGRINTKIGRAFGMLVPVNEKDLVFFFQQMALMLRTGLTLLQALEICYRQNSKVLMQNAIGRIAERVRDGASFSAAMSKETIFPKVAVKMALTAEATGEMSVILDRVSSQLAYAQEIKNNLITSLIYPAMVTVFAGGIIIYLVTNVIPKFVGIIQRQGKTLPTSTQVLIAITNFINENGQLLLAGILSLILFLIMSYSLIPGGRYLLDRLMLSVPFFGSIFSNALMANMGKTLSLLLKSGTPLLEGIKIMRESISNRAIQAQLETVEKRILEGKSFSDSIRSRIIPSLVPEVIAVGEVSGALEIVLEELGTFYDRALQQQIKRLMAMIEPCIIVVLGGSIGFVYFAFLQAVFSMVGGAK